MKTLDLFESRLFVTKRQLETAASNKVQVLALINPETFLEVTTPKGSVDLIKDKARSTADYNKFSKEGETIVMPTLWLRGDNVVGHEGRHRAAALLRNGIQSMLIAIKMSPTEKQVEKYKDVSHEYMNTEYKLSAKDLPQFIYGQYDQGIIWTSKDLEIIADGWNAIRNRSKGDRSTRIKTNWSTPIKKRLG